jgi:hypothetical protein
LQWFLYSFCFAAATRFQNVHALWHDNCDSVLAPPHRTCWVSRRSAMSLRSILNAYQLTKNGLILLEFLLLSSMPGWTHIPCNQFWTQQILELREDNWERIEKTGQLWIQVL